MSLRLFTISILGLSILLGSQIAQASTCSNLANTINNDINMHAKDIRQQNFPWMTLTWLQQKLGKVHGKQDKEQVTYTWSCPESDGSTIIATTDTNGNLNKIAGKFNGAQGEGLFSQCLSSSCDESSNITSTSANVQANVDNTPAASATPGGGSQVGRYRRPPPGMPSQDSGQALPMASPQQAGGTGFQAGRGPMPPSTGNGG